MGLSQQKLADIVGVKRGKVAGYFYETQAKHSFHQKLVDNFHIDLGKFLTVEMDAFNYDSFFHEVVDQGMVGEPPLEYQRKKDPIPLLLKAKNSESKEERASLIEEAIEIYSEMATENSELKDQILEMIKEK